jgi:voltage-gated potassium channel
MLQLPSRLPRPNRRSWLIPIVVIAFVFGTSWLLLAMVEPVIADPAIFWWWFIVTSATVGYGDFAPVTLPGRAVGAYVIVGGIVTLTVIFSKVADGLEKTRSRRMRGQARYSQTGHMVVLGYTPGRTEKLVGAMLASGERVLLGAWDDAVAEHPMAGQDVFFVRGDLADLDVLQRANISRAKGVLIDGRDDDESVTLTVAVAAAAPSVHSVVPLRDISRRRTIEQVNPTAQCVDWHAVAIITGELADPGISKVYQELTRPDGKHTYSTIVPEQAEVSSYGSWQQRLGERHAATLLAIGVDGAFDVSAAWTLPVPAGAVLFYVADRRLSSDDLRRLADAS